MTEYHDRHTMERMRKHLVRADGELEATQHLLDRIRRGNPRWT